MNPHIQSKNTTILPVLIALMLVCFGLSPQARAVCQEGCLTNENTVLGDDALVNKTGEGNTALGFEALLSNTTGSFNVATGNQALMSNTTGTVNTATGVEALWFNTTGSFNTATGTDALARNTTGSNNTATGNAALGGNTTADNNTATGVSALTSNTTGSSNTAMGGLALQVNDTGNNNTAAGWAALKNGRTGSDNTAIGFNALGRVNSSSNIAVGSNAGANLVTGGNNIYIGNAGISSDEHAKIRIGTTGTQRATFIAGISGTTVPAGVGVIVGTDGKLGTIVSSARYKDSIKPMDKASEAILALKPVAFRYKKELDSAGIPQFGLVAEQVEKVDPDLVARDEQGKPFTVRYEAVNAMLLNEFLKEHRKVEKLEATVKQLQSALKEQAAQIQKVSDQLATQAPAPRVVAND